MPDDNDSYNLSGGFEKDSGEEKPDNESTEKAIEKETPLKEGDTDVSNKTTSESATVMSANMEPEQGFIFLVKQTFSVFFKKIGVFLGLALLNIGIFAAFYILVMPMLMTSVMNAGLWAILVVPLIIGLLQTFLTYLFYGTIANQAFNAYNDMTVGVLESFSKVFKITGRAINLGFKIFIYSGVWLVIVVLILTAVANTILGGMGGYYGGIDTAVAQGGLISPMDAPGPMAGAIGEQGSSGNFIMMIVDFVLPLLGLIIIIFAMVRFVRASMAFPILMGNPESSAKEALDDSIRITRGKWWLVVCFGIVFAFLLGLIPALVQIAGMIIGSGNNVVGIVVMVVSLFFALLAFPLITTFYQVFAQELANEARSLKLHIGMIIVTVLIFLAPVLLAVAAPLILQSMINSSFSELDTRDDFYSLQGNNFEQVAVSSLPEVLSAPARARDAGRQGDLNRLVAAVETYNADNGEYLQSSSCIEDLNELSEYFPGDFPEDPSGTQDFAGPDGDITCENGYYYQYFSGDAYAFYALWAKLEDPSKGFADQLFADLDEMREFEKQDSGQYYVVTGGIMLDVAEPAEPVTTSGGVPRL